MERKWTERKYHVQDNADVELKDLKMYCNTNQFPTLPFCGPHSKPHGARGLGKHYHLRLIQNLVWVNVKFAVYHVHVLLVHQCWTNNGYQVYHQRTRML